MISDYNYVQIGKIITLIYFDCWVVFRVEIYQCYNFNLFEHNFNHYTMSIRLIYRITFIIIMLKEAIAQLQQVSNISLNHCGRDAIVKFFGWEGPKINLTLGHRYKKIRDIQVVGTVSLEGSDTRRWGRHPAWPREGRAVWGPLDRPTQPRQAEGGRCGRGRGQSEGATSQQSPVVAGPVNYDSMRGIGDVSLPIVEWDPVSKWMLPRQTLNNRHFLWTDYCVQTSLYILNIYSL